MDDAALIEALRAMPRPDVDTYFLMMAMLAATRGTCGRRRVGCVLVDRNNHVITTGYNGVASGLTHCIDRACPGRDLPSGTGLDKCEALHAEENALIQCTRPDDIYAVYSTTSPCVHCVRRLLNTRARRIVFAEIYPHTEAEDLWTGRTQVDIGGVPQYVIRDAEGRTWTHHPLPQPPRFIVSIPPEPSGPGPLRSSDMPLNTATPS